MAVSPQKWREVADVLAAAMQHNERGICTLTENEHAALRVYMNARRPERLIARSYLGLTGGLDAFRHDSHAPSPEFVISADEP